LCEFEKIDSRGFRETLEEFEPRCHEIEEVVISFCDGALVLLFDELQFVEADPFFIGVQEIEDELLFLRLESLWHHKDIDSYSSLHQRHGFFHFHYHFHHRFGKGIDSRVSPIPISSKP
jgi:hypothetical protein